jgi:nucleotide-binding universal stress UspA family protein
MKIVCGCDLSKHSEAALRAAVALTTRLPVSELWVVHILDAASSSLGLNDLKAAAARSLKQRLDAIEMPSEVKARCEPRAVATPSDGRSMDDALLHFAHRHGADLVLVASQGHGESPLVRLGGTSERLAHAADLPVLVVRDAAPFEAWARKQRPLRVLFGTDGRPSSRPALQLLHQLREAGDCTAVIARVYDAGEAARNYGLSYPVDWLTPDPHLESLIARDLKRELDAPDAGNGVTYRAMLGIGRRGDHLLDVAEREAADLIVVGVRRRGWFDRLSSVSNVVLHFGHASVACVPENQETSHSALRTPKIRRVLAATDLSRLGNQAIVHALSLFGEGAGELFLMHVVTAKEPNTQDALRIGELRQLLPRDGSADRIATRTEIVHSDETAEAIVTAANRVGADVIAVGSHGHTGLRRALLGSVAEAVLRQAQQPVFVVRAPS